MTSAPSDPKIVQLLPPKGSVEALVREARVLIREVDDILDEIEAAVERKRKRRGE